MPGVIEAQKQKNGGSPESNLYYFGLLDIYELAERVAHVLSA